jgi:hypothetical protein
MHLHLNWRIRLILLMTCGLNLSAHADEPNPSSEENAQVVLISSEDERCSANDGKLISLQAKQPKAKLKVWVDRWFMDVKTADHTQHILTAEQAQADLGCSNTYAGTQQWTIYSVTEIPQD